MMTAPKPSKPRNELGCFVADGGVAVANPRDLPDEHKCNRCNRTKPVDEMVVTHLRKERVYYLRPICKDCHNKKERGHRREWKRNYLRQWRKRNRAVNDSYWKGNAGIRERARVNAARRLTDESYHEASLIQGRLRRGAKTRISLAEAKVLLKKFGRCYPTRAGLTKAGLQECERIRSAMRRRGSKRFRPIDIRMMVYDAGFAVGHGNSKIPYFIKPAQQERPYQAAAETLRRWQARQREARAA